MDLKQSIILVAGVAGMLLVVLCPRWYYPPHPLILQEGSIGYRFITQPPKSLSVVEEENGNKSFHNNQVVAPRVDRTDLATRTGLIIAITLLGLWILQRLNQSKIPKDTGF